ncbi:hypothetical protein CHS0354_041653 [Potamilus streckersoni]|uniref:Hexosyltransferase n=1 Tax=Potamilus streckersoni TaxID=2493646 RepID=A0AAE0VTG4_9BIVA|nr:hypothetical protein CHS0354_041653 [Potamilus streckersoni]
MTRRKRQLGFLLQFLSHRYLKVMLYANGPRMLECPCSRSCRRSVSLKCTLIATIGLLLYSLFLYYPSQSIVEKNFDRIYFYFKNVTPLRTLVESDKSFHGHFYISSSIPAILPSKHYHVHEVANSKQLEKRDNINDLSTNNNVYKSKIIYEYISSRDKNNVKFPLTAFDSLYSIQNGDICMGTNNLVLLAMVHSSAKYFQRRHSIRNTWGNINMFKKFDVRIVFLLGLPDDRSTQIQIDEESSKYGDIVQGDFLDTYRNLTNKAVLGLRWIFEFCPHAKRIVKVDDDVFVNIFTLLDNVLNVFPSDHRMIRCFHAKPGSAPILRKGTKWNVESDVFPVYKTWPMNFCYGFFVLETPDVIHELYQAAMTTPFLWLDDVYVFGLLAEAIGGITFSKLNVAYLEGHRALKCFTESKCHSLTAFARNDKLMNNLLSGVVKNYGELVKNLTGSLSLFL